MRDEITVTLDELDFVEAYRPAPRSRRMAALVLSLAIILGLLIVVLLIRFPDARIAFRTSPLIIALSGAVLLAATLVLGLVLSAPSLRRRAAQSTLADHPGMRDPVNYAFDKDFFRVTSTYTRARYPWPQLWDWRENERVIIVMPTPRNFYVLPKRGVDGGVLERLRGHLSEARRRTKAP